jgi:hypothetical protein
MAPYPSGAPVLDAFAASRTILDQIITRLGDEQMMSCTAQLLEEYVTSAGRDLQRQLMQDQLDARAAAEHRRAVVAGADHVVRHRAEPGHARLVATTVGRVQVTRIAYRAAGVSNLYPADAQLALPDRLYSFPLQRLVVHEAVTGSLREARDALVRGTGQQVGTRQLMEMVVAAARDVRGFYQQQPIPAGSPADLLVLSIDATGVAMIPTDLREAAPAASPGPRPPSAQLASRDRTGRSRMAAVTACYDAVPAPRTPADVLPADAAERARRQPGPHAAGRYLDASLEHGTATMTTRLFDHAEHRDPQHRRRWIALVDGNNHQLDRIGHEARTRGVHVDIIIDCPTSTTTSPWPWAGRSPPASSKAPAATWSKTALTSPAPAGASPAPKPSYSCEP